MQRFDAQRRRCLENLLSAWRREQRDSRSKYTEASHQPQCGPDQRWDRTVIVVPQSLGQELREGAAKSEIEDAEVPDDQPD